MPSTHHLVDEDFLKGMKPGSRIVNTARGQVVDESALVKALNSGHILSAGLDGALPSSFRRLEGIYLSCVISQCTMRNRL